MNTSNKKILITGASTGFELLAKNGHTVYPKMRNITGRNQNLTEWANDQKVKLKVVELNVTSDEC